MLRVGSLGHVFDIGGFNGGAEVGFHFLAGDVVLERPAEIADRPEIDEPHLERLGGGGAAERQRRRGGGEPRSKHLVECPTIHNVSPLLPRRSIYLSGAIFHLRRTDPVNDRSRLGGAARRSKARANLAR